ncbi:hypothetical protein DC094_08040 [Pelagibaculum spongiae]|uniref:Uncharacterized protein n=1 Tax=Pelagibaculum spongiae TaxID=2080658 RepID=A0A2V1H253_9GAMM|nr:hypothetical protein DC094_08040 [Pelagibaculum spongiae]
MLKVIAARYLFKVIIFYFKNKYLAADLADAEYIRLGHFDIGFAHSYAKNSIFNIKSFDFSIHREQLISLSIPTLN